VHAADLEDLLTALVQAGIPGAALLDRVALVVFLAEAALVPALLDVAEQLDADLVGIEPAGAVASVPE
jgi:hypothetical protein